MAVSAQTNHRVAVRVRAVQLRNLAPASDIVPADADRDYNKATGLLQHPLIDSNDARQPWPRISQNAFHLSRNTSVIRARRRANLIQNTGDSRYVTPDFFKDTVNPPDENSAIPDVISC